MSIQLLKKLPTPTEIKADYPVTQKVAQIKAERDEMIRKVFTGESDKFLVIIGPCSADNEEAVCEYINRLSRVQEEVADKLILIPRIYTNFYITVGCFSRYGFVGSVCSCSLKECFFCGNDSVSGCTCSAIAPEYISSDCCYFSVSCDRCIIQLNCCSSFGVQQCLAASTVSYQFRTVF